MFLLLMIPFDEFGGVAVLGVEIENAESSLN